MKFFLREKYPAGRTDLAEVHPLHGARPTGSLCDRLADDSPCLGNRGPDDSLSRSSADAPIPRFRFKLRSVFVD